MRERKLSTAARSGKIALTVTWRGSSGKLCHIGSQRKIARESFNAGSTFAAAANASQIDQRPACAKEVLKRPLLSPYPRRWGGETPPHQVLAPEVVDHADRLQVGQSASDLLRMPSGCAYVHLCVNSAQIAFTKCAKFLFYFNGRMLDQHLGAIAIAIDHLTSAEFGALGCLYGVPPP